MGWLGAGPRGDFLCHPRQSVPLEVAPELLGCYHCHPAPLCQGRRWGGVEQPRDWLSVREGEWPPGL